VTRGVLPTTATADGPVRRAQGPSTSLPSRGPRHPGTHYRHYHEFPQLLRLCYAATKMAAGRILPRRTRFTFAPLFIVAPALPAYRAMLYRSTINVENGGRPMVGIIDPVRTMTALLRCRMIRWADILACFISRVG